MTKQILVKQLYETVDARNTDGLSKFLSDTIRFRIGNHDTVVGRRNVLAANDAFFNSIAGMTHKIENIWVQGEDVICNGSVDYVRLDGTPYSAHFATTLKMRNEVIEDYFVYADISQL
ncbi:hypothetical protein A9Q83_00065 [Alphaproteobacteria bacterium 46_93_T64]|nr:hypothetical protein A9Q83_00065 [Alphaproteobacteria bacterium 46_93_T64]